MRHALYFVPHRLEREKLALMRRQLCKRFGNRKAVMYPVHMTLVRSLQLSDYKEFMRALERLCAKRKPIKFRLSERLVSRSGWGGIEALPSEQLAAFQRELEDLCVAHGGLERFPFDAHISLVHAKNLPSLRGKTSPVKKLLLDRIALIIQTEDGQPYRIARHVALGDGPVDLED
jgi:hypothetical protein